MSFDSYYQPDESMFVAECVLCSRPLREDEVDCLASGEAACSGCAHEGGDDGWEDTLALTFEGDVRNIPGGY